MLLWQEQVIAFMNITQIEESWEIVCMYVEWTNAKLSQCLVSEIIIKTGPWHSMKTASVYV